ncbi:hypothetical protein ACIRTB_11760 [Streptomyces sp. NPDC101158]|uniref:hypothetical protein n=1 Tax=Streptomyces sp. NPDC101158 TaxID=3366117 RepID=UPI00380FEE1A
MSDLPTGPIPFTAEQRAEEAAEHGPQAAVHGPRAAVRILGGSGAPASRPVEQGRRNAEPAETDDPWDAMRLGFVRGL